MKINMIKEPGGLFRPFDDMEQEKTIRFKTGELYEVDIKLTRNPGFHRKVFAFFNFCEKYWSGNEVMEHGTPEAQRKRFRNDLTVFAGYYTPSIGIDGSINLDAKSLAYANMEQEEFEHFYTSLINAACKHIFKDADENIYNRLLSFF